MPHSTKTALANIDLRFLRSGDIVDVHQLDGRWTYHGEIDTVDPSRRGLWILHGALKERKLLEASEYQFCRCLSGQPAMPCPSATIPAPRPRDDLRLEP